MKLYFIEIKGHLLTGHFDSGPKCVYDWTNGSSTSLLNEIKTRIYPQLDSLTAFIVHDERTPLCYRYWNYQLDTPFRFGQFANYLKENEASRPGNEISIHILQHKPTLPIVDTLMIAARKEEGRKNLALYFAIVKERSSTGTFVHDGFMPFTWDTADLDLLVKKIEEIEPQLQPNTKMLVIDKYGDEIIAWPHKDEQLKDFSIWLRTNYSDGERIKIYIEPNATGTTHEPEVVSETQSAPVQTNADLESHLLEKVEKLAGELIRSAVIDIMKPVEGLQLEVKKLKEESAAGASFRERYIPTSDESFSHQPLIAHCARDEVDEASYLMDIGMVKTLIEEMNIADQLLQDKFSEVKKVIANLPNSRSLVLRESIEVMQTISEMENEENPDISIPLKNGSGSPDADEAEFEIIHKDSNEKPDSATSHSPLASSSFTSNDDEVIVLDFKNVEL